MTLTRPFRIALLTAAGIGLGVAAAVPVGLLWRGNTVEARVPPADAKAAQAWRDFAAARQRQIDDEARALMGYAEASLDGLLDPQFARFEARVPEFGAWAFRWRTSYALLREGAKSAAEWPMGDRQVGFRQSMQNAWDDLVVGQFESLVLEPAGGAKALEDVRRRWWEQMARATRDAAIDDLLVVALYQQRPLVPGAEVPSSAAVPAGPLEFHPLDGAPGQLEGRMIRPVAARLAFRAPAVATATVVGEAVAGATDLAVLGGPAGLVLTVAGVLGIDYLISRADEAASRESFEEDIRQALHKAKSDLRSRWLAEAKAEIDRQMGYSRAQLDGPVRAIAAKAP